MDKAEERFHLPWRSPVIFMPAIAYLVLAAYAWPHEMLAALILAKGTFVIVILRAAISLTVDQQGIRINWFKKAAWADVEAARRTSFVGLPYLRVTLRAGLYKHHPLWVPLYVSGTRTVEAALVERAPPDNPLRIYAESTIHA